MLNWCIFRDFNLYWIVELRMRLIYKIISSVLRHWIYANRTSLWKNKFCFAISQSWHSLVLWLQNMFLLVAFNNLIMLVQECCSWFDFYVSLCAIYLSFLGLFRSLSTWYSYYHKSLKSVYSALQTSVVFFSFGLVCLSL